MPFFEIIDLFEKYKEWIDNKKKQSADDNTNYQAKIEKMKGQMPNFSNMNSQIPKMPDIPQVPDIPKVDLNAYSLPNFPE